MQITLSTVGGAKTSHTVEPADTVRSVKERMEEYDIATLRVCFKGKVLGDDTTFEAAGVGDGSNLVIAGKKKAISKPAEAKPAEAPALDTASARPTVQNTTAPSSSPAAATAGGVEPAAPASSSITAGSSTTGASSAPPVSSTPAPSAPGSTAGVDSALIDSIVAMGFPDRAEVAVALRAAFMNADRAVEYLCTGIPEHARRSMEQAVPRPLPPATVPAGDSAAGAPTADAGAPTGDAAAFGLMLQQQMEAADQATGSELQRALALIPQFDRIRELVRGNRAALPMVMEQLNQRHPDAFRLVQANPQEFIDIINSEDQLPAAGTGGEGAEGDARPVTAADEPAIQRLVALGGGVWDMQAAALVYLAARRNEELAANILLEHGGIPPELLQALAAGGMPPGADDDEEGEEEDEEED